MKTNDTKPPFDAEAVAKRLLANVAAINAGEISWDEFNVRARAAWDDVAQGEPHILDTDCALRHEAVNRILDANRKGAAQ